MVVDPHTWIVGPMKEKAIYKPPHGKIRVRTHTDRCACGTIRHSSYAIGEGNVKKWYLKDGVKYPRQRIPPCQEGLEVRPLQILSPMGHNWVDGPWIRGEIPYRTRESKGSKVGFYRIVTCACGLERIDRRFRAGAKIRYYRDGQLLTKVPPCSVV